MGATIFIGADRRHASRAFTVAHARFGCIPLPARSSSRACPASFDNHARQQWIVQHDAPIIRTSAEAIRNPGHGHGRSVRLRRVPSCMDDGTSFRVSPLFTFVRESMRTHAMFLSRRMRERVSERERAHRIGDFPHLAKVLRDARRSVTMPSSVHGPAHRSRDHAATGRIAKNCNESDRSVVRNAGSTV